jgi:hypothetical protein
MRYDFEVHADYEVVWNGGELLPPRESAIDQTWNDAAVLLPGGKEFCTVERVHRRYRKVRREFWSKYDGPPAHALTERHWGSGDPPLRHRPTHPPHPATAEGGGSGGQSSPCVSDAPGHAERSD